MVAAQRPSVSVALGRLAELRRLLRPNKGDWLLTGPALAKLAPLTRQTGL
jgi:hypothetical protein